MHVHVPSQQEAATDQETYAKEKHQEKEENEEKVC
jgi:hypothetical protein